MRAIPLRPIAYGGTLLLLLIIWMSSPTHLSLAQPAFPAAGTVTANANLRTGPGTTFAIAGRARQGQAVQLTGCNTTCDWYELERGTWIAAFLVDVVPVPATAAATREPITVVGWNTDLNDAAVAVIAERIAAFEDVDLWGLAEVNHSAYASTLETAAEAGEAAEYAAILGESGGGDRLLAIYDATRFTLVESWELEDINTTGNVRAPLVLHLREIASEEEILFMVNHLYRSREEERYKQAQLLNAWAVEQTLPVIAVGDYNFDWAITNGSQDHDRGYDLLTDGGVLLGSSRRHW